MSLFSMKTHGDITYFFCVNDMNNWDPNEENVKTVVKNGRVYMKIGNQMILVRNAPKASVNKKHNVNVHGPGTYFRNNPNKKKNALNVVRNTQTRQLKHTTGNLLSLPYVSNKLQSVGRQTFKNWVALSKNNESVRGFAIVHNSRNGRNVNVLATNAGKGIGRLLMNRIIANAKKNGKAIIFLTSVKSATPFYNKMGFQRRTNNETEKLIPMTLRLR